MQYTIKELRARHNLTQDGLARLVGLTTRTIQSFESDIENLRNTSYKNIERLAKALKVEVGDIFLG